MMVIPAYPEEDGTFFLARTGYKKLSAIGTLIFYSPIGQVLDAKLFLTGSTPVRPPQPDGGKDRFILLGNSLGARMLHLSRGYSTVGIISTKLQNDRQIPNSQYPLPSHGRRRSRQMVQVEGSVKAKEWCNGR